MPKHIAWLWAIGCFGLLGAANAQTPPPATAGTPYDGRYRLASSAKVNATYTTRKGQMGQCPDRRAGSLIIVNGRARYTTASGYKVRGTVGPQGELTMQVVAPSNWGSHPIDLSVSGSIDGNGTARVRQQSYSCSYDFVWQKASR